MDKSQTLVPNVVTSAPISGSKGQFVYTYTNIVKKTSYKLEVCGCIFAVSLVHIAVTGTKLSIRHLNTILS